MRKIAIYGKGGIGKSTTTQNSGWISRDGKKSDGSGMRSQSRFNTFAASRTSTKNGFGYVA
jgi:hypothetical protein